MDKLVESYKSALVHCGYKSALVDYLTSIVARTLSEINTLNGFTPIKIDVSIVASNE